MSCCTPSKILQFLSDHKHQQMTNGTRFHIWFKISHAVSHNTYWNHIPATRNPHILRYIAPYATYCETYRVYRTCLAVRVPLLPVFPLKSRRAMQNRDRVSHVSQSKGARIASAKNHTKTQIFCNVLLHLSFIA